MTLRHKEGGEAKPQPQMDADSFGVVTNDSYRRAFFASLAVVSIRGPFLRFLRPFAAIPLRVLAQLVRKVTPR